MNADGCRGSIAPLGLLSLGLSLTCALTLLCAGSLFQQQRALNAIAGAIALNVAEVPDHLGRRAELELSALLNAQSSGVRLEASWLGDDASVFVKICQPARVAELLVPQNLVTSAFGDVCATAHAGLLANT